MKRQNGLIRKKGILFLLMMGFSSLSFALEHGQISQWESLLHGFLVFLVGAFIVSAFVYKQFIRDHKHSEKKHGPHQQGHQAKKNHQLKRSHKVCCIG